MPVPEGQRRTVQVKLRLAPEAAAALELLRPARPRKGRAYGVMSYERIAILLRLGLSGGHVYDIVWLAQLDADEAKVLRSRSVDAEASGLRRAES